MSGWGSGIRGRRERKSALTPALSPRRGGPLRRGLSWREWMGGSRVDEWMMAPKVDFSRFPQARVDGLMLIQCSVADGVIRSQSPRGEVEPIVLAEAQVE